MEGKTADMEEKGDRGCMSGSGRKRVTDKNHGGGTVTDGHDSGFNG